jgi:hypothetical protein
MLINIKLKILSRFLTAEFRIMLFFIVAGGFFSGMRRVSSLMNSSSIWASPSWMPDRMGPGRKPGLGAIAPEGFPKFIRLQSDIAGQLWLADYYVNADKKILGLISAWRKQP